MPKSEPTAQQNVLIELNALAGLEKMFSEHYKGTKLPAIFDSQQSAQDYEQLRDFSDRHNELCDRLNTAIHGLANNEDNKPFIKLFEQHKNIGNVLSKLANFSRLAQPLTLKEIIISGIIKDIRELKSIQQSIRDAHTMKQRNKPLDETNHDLKQIGELKQYLKESIARLDASTNLSVLAVDEIVAQIQSQHEKYFNALIAKSTNVAEQQIFKTSLDKINTQLNRFRPPAIAASYANHITLIKNAAQLLAENQAHLPSSSSIKRRELPATPIQQSMKAELAEERKSNESIHSPSSESKSMR